MRVTSAGQRHDSLAFIPLMGRLKIARRAPGRPRTRPGRVLADKAYSSAAIRSHLRRRRIRATIPEPADQIRNRRNRGSRGGRPPAFDPQAYKQRNIVERAFCRLRQHRAVATRYDKRDFACRGTIDVAAIRIWLRDLTQQDLRDTPYGTRPSRPDGKLRARSSVDDGPCREYPGPRDAGATDRRSRRHLTHRQRGSR